MSKYLKWSIVFGIIMIYLFIIAVPFIITANYIWKIFINDKLVTPEDIVILIGTTAERIPEQFDLYLNYISAYLVVDDELMVADAIVVLIGGTLERIPEAYDLYIGGYAQEIILVQECGAHDETTESKLFAIELGIPEEIIIILPGHATSTRDEADIVRNYLSHRPDIESLILVTSSQHTRRAITTFKKSLRTLDRNILLISRASRYSYFQEEQWWLDHKSTEHVFWEYIKIIYYNLL